MYSGRRIREDTRLLSEAIKEVTEYMFKNYGAVLAPEESCNLCLDENEKLLCGFVFPDDMMRSKVIGRKIEDVTLFPDMTMLFIYNLDSGEIYNRVCQGEARGIPWETIDMLCKSLYV